METDPDEVTLMETDVKSWSISSGGSSERYDTFGTLVLTEGSLIWKQADQKGREVTPIRLPLNEVIAVTSGVEKSQELVIHHVVREQRYKWLNGSVVFELNNAEVCCQWKQRIVGKLADPMYQRPTSLLVLINPNSGKQTAESVYSREVAPLFELAGITVDKKVSEKKESFHEILDTYDLNTVDGIVCVGGDGTFNDMCSALMMRTSKDNHIDTSDPRLTLPKPALRVGMIPAGSGNEMAHYTTGLKDPQTCALRIIVGDDISLDVCSVYQNNRPLSLGTLLMVGYGFYGDVGAIVEEYRHIGILRIFYAVGKTLYHHRTFKAEAEYLPAEGDGDFHKGTSEWQKLEGEFQTMCCWCNGLPVGRDTLLRKSSRPITEQFSNLGKLGVSFVSKCSRWQELKHMSKIFRRIRPANEPTAFDMDFVTAVEVSECRVKIVPTGEMDEVVSALNIDGENIKLDDPPTFHIKIHPKRLRMFARGVEDDSDHLS